MVNLNWLLQQISRIRPIDAARVFSGRKTIRRRAASGPLKRLVTDIHMLIDLLGDYFYGRYRQPPWWTIAAIIFALLYVLNPFDLIPDHIPLLGLLDDLAVVGIVLAMTEQDISEYKRWRKRKDRGKEEDKTEH